MDLYEARLSVFVLLIENGKWMYILLYDGKLIVVHEDNEAITEFGNVINEHFTVNDLGEITYHFRIQIEREADGSFLLNQSAKIEAVLSQFRMENSKGASIPMDAAYPKLEGGHNCLRDNDLYRQAVGFFVV